MRRRNLLLPITAHIAITKVIGYNENNVWFAATIGALRIRNKGKDNQTNQEKAMLHKGEGKE
jgi:hypothetical protein